MCFLQPYSQRSSTDTQLTSRGPVRDYKQVHNTFTMTADEIAPNREVAVGSIAREIFEEYIREHPVRDFMNEYPGSDDKLLQLRLVDHFRLLHQRELLDRLDEANLGGLESIRILFEFNSDYSLDALAVEALRNAHIPADRLNLVVLRMVV